MCLFSISDLICNPILTTFPQLMDQPDLMDALRVCYLHIVQLYLTCQDFQIFLQNLRFFFYPVER